MKPFIKWPGGKDSELKYILPAKPHVIRNYVEPFLGGGAVFFALADEEVTGSFYINDLSDDLIETYRLVQMINQDFFDEMVVIDQNSKRMTVIVDDHFNQICDLYAAIRSIVFEEYHRIENEKMKNVQAQEIGEDTKTEIQSITNKEIIDLTLEEDGYTKYDKELIKAAEQNVKDQRNILIDRFINEISNDLVLNGNVNIDNNVFLASIKAMIVRRINSMILQNLDADIQVTNMKDVFECVFKAAFYTHLRDIYNKRNSEDNIFNTAQIAAMYLYIRDNCYSAMHRTNPRGEFNVPYGGISYNPHDFGVKRNYLLNENLQARLRRAIISNEDFEVFMNGLMANTTEDDFWFIDPPYDSTFSEYSQNEFGPEDHRRLAAILSRTPAKVMVVIKRTDFIENLYKQYPNFNISTFSKLYDVNFHNRNSREVEHLIITNYEILTN